MSTSDIRPQLSSADRQLYDIKKTTDHDAEDEEQKVRHPLALSSTQYHSLQHDIYASLRPSLLYPLAVQHNMTPASLQLRLMKLATLQQLKQKERPLWSSD